MKLQYLYWWVATGVISNILNYILKLTFTKAFEDLENKNRFILCIITVISIFLGYVEFMIFIKSLLRSVFTQDKYREDLIRNIKEGNKIYDITTPYWKSLIKFIQTKKL